MLQRHEAPPALQAERDGSAIEARGLVMRYGDREVLHGINLTVPQGMVVGFLGPNGAGKTTTVEILEGYRRRSAGHASVLGMDPATGGRELRERIGIVLQETGHNQELTVRETVRQFAGYYRRPRPVDEVIGLVGLEEAADRRVRALSGGQRRRLDVGLALVGDPELVFLDEPTTGFDPAARRQAWEVIGGLRDLGKTILLTTHYMDEAQALADRVAIIAAGRIVAEGTPDELAAAQRGTEIHFTLPAHAAPAELPRVSGRVATRGRNVEIATDDPTHDLLALLGWAAGRGAGRLDGLTVTRPSLEDIYLALTSDTEEAA
ncbi:MAG TPA: ABC transporter ATP-binding protein [Actinomycetota bacterium]|nr:ABC transporter ATP-binding protein [Actinomycetota bacterium]